MPNTPKTARERAQDEQLAADIETVNRKLLKKYGDDTQRQFFHVLAQDPSVLRNMVARVCGEKYKETTSQRHARTIMGRNFCGVGEAAIHFDYAPSESELLMLAEVPLTKEELELSKHTHFLFAYLPRSLREIEAVQQVTNCVFYTKEEFVDTRGEPGWYLIPKMAIVGSSNRTFLEQRAMLPPNEELPLESILVYAILLHLAHKDEAEEQLFRGLKLRSASCLRANPAKQKREPPRVVVGSHESALAGHVHLAQFPDDQALPCVAMVGVRRLLRPVKPPDPPNP